MFWWLLKLITILNVQQGVVNNIWKLSLMWVRLTIGYSGVFFDVCLLKWDLLLILVEIIMLYVSIVSYSFLLNGKLFGALQPARGLRQRDPLSTYLFICCTEAFIRMVEVAVSHGRLNGIRVALTTPMISNLYFAVLELWPTNKLGGCVSSMNLFELSDFY